jgi:diguanylate cyclase (GGDEF)-like protein
MYNVGDDSPVHGLMPPIMDNKSPQPIISSERYRLLPSARRGSAAGTILAFDKDKNRNVVLIESRKSASTAGAEGLDDRASALTSLSHVSLVNVWDVYSEGDRKFLVAEPVEGRNLAELFSKERTPALSNILVWADDLFDLLIYLHSRPEPFIHGDIHPENVWLTISSRVKLNFPSFRRTNREVPGEDGKNVDVSLPYRSLENVWEDLDGATKFVISRGFADAPIDEMLKSTADERADIYSLAATLYFAMTRVKPVDAMTRTVTILDGSDDPVRPVFELNSDVSEAISDVIMRGFAVKRADRYQTAYEMRMALLSATEPHFDNLTRLPNDVQFVIHLRSIIDRINGGEETSFVVMLIELDNLKAVYERLGRLAADEVMIRLADRIKSSVRINDIIGRVSENTFALLLFEAGTASDIVNIAARVQTRLAEPVTIDNERIEISSSAGVSSSSSVKKEPRQFLVEASSAVVDSRNTGPNSCAIS